MKFAVTTESFGYQAQSWKKPRRVVAKVEWHPGELYPRVGFIVTNLTLPAERVVAFYNHRGTAEQWIKEGKKRRGRGFTAPRSYRAGKNSRSLSSWLFPEPRTGAKGSFPPSEPFKIEDEDSFGSEAIIWTRAS
jgi:hypothetical protein